MTSFLMMTTLLIITTLLMMSLCDDILFGEAPVMGRSP
jgi:hypothetical protein